MFLPRSRYCIEILECSLKLEVLLQNSSTHVLQCFGLLYINV
jgi:hypothetical protein